MKGAVEERKRPGETDYGRIMWEGVKFARTGFAVGFTYGGLKSLGGMAAKSSGLTAKTEQVWKSITKTTGTLNPLEARSMLVGGAITAGKNPESFQKVANAAISGMSAVIDPIMNKTAGAVAWVHGKSWGDEEMKDIGKKLWEGGENGTTLEEIKKDFIKEASTNWDKDRVLSVGYVMLALGVEAPKTYFTMFALGKITQGIGIFAGKIPYAGATVQGVINAVNQYGVVAPYYLSLAQQGASLYADYQSTGKVDKEQAADFVVNVGSLLAASGLLAMKHTQDRIAKENVNNAATRPNAQPESLWSNEVFTSGLKGFANEARRLVMIGGTGAIGEVAGIGATTPVIAGLASASYIQLGVQETAQKIQSGKGFIEAGEKVKGTEVLVDSKASATTKNGTLVMTPEVGVLGWLLGVTTEGISIDKDVSAKEIQISRELRKVSQAGLDWVLTSPKAQASAKEEFVQEAAKFVAQKQQGDQGKAGEYAEMLKGSFEGAVSRESVIRQLAQRQYEIRQQKGETWGTAEGDWKYAEAIYAAVESLQGAYKLASEGKTEGIREKIALFNHTQEWIDSGRKGSLWVDAASLKDAKSSPATGAMVLGLEKIAKQIGDNADPLKQKVAQQELVSRQAKVLEVEQLNQLSTGEGSVQIAGFKVEANNVQDVARTELVKRIFAKGGEPLASKILEQGDAALGSLPKDLQGIKISPDLQTSLAREMVFRSNDISSPSTQKALEILGATVEKGGLGVYGQILNLRMLYAQNSGDQMQIARSQKELEAFDKSIKTANNLSFEVGNDGNFTAKGQELTGDRVFEMRKQERLMDIVTKTQALKSVRAAEDSRVQAAETHASDPKATAGDRVILNQLASKLKAKIDIAEKELLIARMGINESGYKHQVSELARLVKASQKADVDFIFTSRAQALEVRIKELTQNTALTPQQRETELKIFTDLLAEVKALKEVTHMILSGERQGNLGKFEKAAKQLSDPIRGNKNAGEMAEALNLQAVYRDVESKIRVAKMDLDGLLITIKGSSFEGTKLGEQIIARAKDTLNTLEGQKKELLSTMGKKNMDVAAIESIIAQDRTMAEDFVKIAKQRDSLAIELKKAQEDGKSTETILSHLEKVNGKYEVLRSQMDKRTLEIQENYVTAARYQIAQAEKGTMLDAVIEYALGSYRLLNAKELQALDKFTVVEGKRNGLPHFTVEISSDLSGLNAAQKIYARDYQTKINNVIEKISDIKAKAMGDTYEGVRQIQVELAVRGLLSRNSAFEAGTGSGKTSFMIELFAEGSKQLFGDQYGKRIAILDRQDSADSAFRKLGKEFAEMGNKAVLLKEADLHNPAKLKEALAADTIFMDPSVAAFAYNEIMRPDSKSWVAKAMYSMFRDRPYLIEDEFHVAATDNTPHQTGVGKLAIQKHDPTVLKAEAIVFEAMSKALGETWYARDQSFFVGNTLKERGLTLTEQIKVLNAVLESYVTKKGVEELGLKFDSKKPITIEKIRERMGEVEKESAIAGNQEWIKGAKEFAKDVGYLIDTMHKTALVSGWQMGPGYDYGIVEGKIVPVHNGKIAPHMNFSDSAIVVALEYLHAAKTGSKVSPSKLASLEVSPEALSTTWTRVLTDFKEHGGNILGMTATLRGVKGIVNFGFDMGVNIAQDPYHKYFGDHATNPVKSATVIKNLEAGIELAFKEKGRDVVIIKQAGGVEGLSEPATLEMLKAKVKGEAKTYLMYMDGEKVYLSRGNALHEKPIELSGTQQEWLLARNSTEAVKKGINSLVEPGARVVAYINRPGSIGTDWKMAKEVKGFVIFDKMTGDIAAYQTLGRFREAVDINGKYTTAQFPDKEVLVIGGREKGGKIELGGEFISVEKVDGKYKIGSKDLLAMLTMNGIEERQKSQLEMARVGLMQNTTTFLEGRIRDAESKQEAEGIAGKKMKWQNQSMQNTQIGDSPLPAEAALLATYRKGAEFLETELNGMALSKKNRTELDRTLKAIADNQTFGFGEDKGLTGAEQNRISLKGGLYGASNPAEGMRYIYSKLVSSDLPKVASFGARPDVQMGTEKIQNMVEQQIGRALAPEEVAKIRTAIEEGNPLKLASSPILPTVLADLMTSQGSSATTTAPAANALNRIQQLQSASPEVFSAKIQEFGINLSALGINANPGTMNGLTDAERATLAYEVFNKEAGFSNLSDQAKDLVASAVHPLYTYQDLEQRTAIYQIYNRLDNNLAKSTPVYFDTSFTSVAKQIAASQKSMRNWIMENVFNKAQPQAIYSYDSKTKGAVTGLLVR